VLVPLEAALERNCAEVLKPAVHEVWCGPLPGLQKEPAGRKIIGLLYSKAKPDAGSSRINAKT
jgi:hypothetical protein